MTLEKKLTDALDAAARTVPDTAQSPTLPIPAPRRRPVLVIAVVVAAVVAAVVVPLALSRHNDTSGEIATGACPTPPSVQPLKIPQQNAKPGAEDLNKLPFGPAPRVPFTMETIVHGGLYLEDRGVRVPLETGYRYSSLGRVACGWAAVREEAPDATEGEVGVLTTAGTFISFGHLIRRAVLSPDGTELAYVDPINDHQGRLRVVKVATGKETAGYLTDEKAEPVGWNSAGVWFLPDGDNSKTSLWSPGSEPLRVDTGGSRLTAYRTTDRMMLSDETDPRPGTCVRVVVLSTSHQLKTLREKCGSHSGTLSPDGEVLAFTTGTSQAVMVDTGAATRLKVSQLVFSADQQSIWEDATDVTGKSSAGGRDITIRCDVISGRCERIADGIAAVDPAEPRLGYP